MRLREYLEFNKRAKTLNEEAGPYTLDDHYYDFYHEYKAGKIFKKDEGGDLYFYDPEKDSGEPWTFAIDTVFSYDFHYPDEFLPEVPPLCDAFIDQLPVEDFVDKLLNNYLWESVDLDTQMKSSIDNTDGFVFAGERYIYTFGLVKEANGLPRKGALCIDAGWDVVPSEFMTVLTYDEFAARLTNELKTALGADSAPLSTLMDTVKKVYYRKIEEDY